MEPEHLAIEQRLTLSQAIFKIAQAFVSLDSYGAVIYRALRTLGSEANACRAYLFVFDHSNRTMDNTHEWCNTGITPQIENLKGLPLDLFPWWMEKLQAGEIIDIEDVDEIGEYGKAERDILREQDVKSVLVLPIEVDKVLTGFVGLDNVQSAVMWDKGTKDYLRVAADMIGLSMKRLETEKQILQQKNELELAYENLKATQAQLVHSERLAGIGQLAAGVAHEINNPVGFITSNTTTLKNYLNAITEILLMYRKGSSREDIQKRERDAKIDYILEDLGTLIEENMEGLARVTEIVKNLRDFARIDQKDKCAVSDLNEGLRSSLLIARNEIKYYADVKTDFSLLPPVVCDISELNQVFLNILVNAAQAIRSQNRQEKGLITVTSRHEDDTVVCEISDNGSGISDENKKKIFDPFFTTKDVGKGTGLGLSISYDIVVNKHHGTISVTDNPGGGSVFRIELPVEGRVEAGRAEVNI